MKRNLMIPVNNATGEYDKNWESNCSKGFNNTMVLKWVFNYGKFHCWSVEDAQNLTETSAMLEAFEYTKMKWFGNKKKECQFKNAMTLLKQFSFGGAHPIAMDGTLVNFKMATKLVNEMLLKDANQKQLQKVALTYKTNLRK